MICFKLSYAAPSNFTLHASNDTSFRVPGRSVAAHHDCLALPPAITRRVRSESKRSGMSAAVWLTR
jgi:hypothetical protein